MKKLLSVISLVILVWSCSKKMTPSKSEIPASNTGSSGQNNTGNTDPATVAPLINSATTGTTDPASPAARPVPASRTVNPEEASMIAGQNTFNAKCNRCHGLKIPSDYTADRWISVLQVMAIKANLSPDEKENVLAFVKGNAKK